MSFAEIKDAAASLSPRQRRHLTAHLLTLERRSCLAFRRKLARKLDDKNPARWVSLEEAQARLR